MVALFFFTLLLGCISTWITKRLTGQWATPSTFFWSGWVLCTGAAPLAESLGIVPEINEYGKRLVIESNIAAFTAFLFSSILLRKKFNKSTKNLTYGINFNSNFYRLHIVILNLIIICQFILGIAMLIIRVQQGGVTVLFDMLEMRNLWLNENYLVNTLPIENRIFAVLTFFASIRIAYQAIQDCRSEKFSLRKVTLFILAGAPGGISTGGRIWIALPVSFYVVSFLVTLDRERIYGAFRKVAKKMALALAVSVALFSAAGFIRETQMQGGGAIHFLKADRPDILLVPAYYYISGPFVAIGYYSEFSANYPKKGHGRYGFPFIWRQISRIGLLPPEQVQVINWINDSRDYVYSIDFRIGTTHASYINTFIGDFGRAAFPFVAFVYFFIVNSIWSIYHKSGIAGHVISCQIMLVGTFFTPQEASLAAPNGMITIVGVIGLVLMGRIFTSWRGKNVEAC